MPNYLEQIKELEEELKKTKYNKRTQHHIGLVKAKLAKLKDKQVKRSGSKGKVEGYSVRKTGDSTVILVGYPSVGKSTLLNELTNANSRIGHYAFTTLSVIPGLLEYKHAKIQVLDVPGVVMGAAAGTGRGKEVLSVMRTADLVVFIVDVNHPGHLKILQKEVYDSNIRVNKPKSDVRIHKTPRGGIRIGKTVRLKFLDNKTIEDILREFKIINAEILIRSVIDVDGLIDCIEDNKHFMPGVVVVNKIDAVSNETAQQVMKRINADLGISAVEGTNINELKEMIFTRLNLMRLYLKEPNKKADMVEPLIIFTKATLGDLCKKLHKDFMTKFKFARMWGKSVKFDGQKILKLKHVLKDEDVVELHMK